jgi:L-ascorbate metabolism protein UlaG (beta-lactamase superfamily)
MMTRRLAMLLWSVCLVGVTTAHAGTTTLTWHGHATFEIITPRGQVLMIDPWLRNPVNPNAKDDKNPIDVIKEVDYILVTHGHFDHVSDAVELAKKTGARLVATFELGDNLRKLHGYPKALMGFDTLMNIGGEITVADGEVMIAMTPAVHSSGLRNPHARTEEPDLVYGGNPVGFVLKIAGGPVVYHTGDTAFFTDMALIGEHYHPDVALINIGGHFGMEPAMAARAAIAVRPGLAIPQHFATFPVLTQDPAEFTAALKKAGIASLVMQPGESVVFEGAKRKE